MSHLTNLEIRVKKYQKGWAVQRKVIFGLWVHIIGYSGMEEKQYLYSTKEMAIKEAKKFFEWDLLQNIN